MTVRSALSVAACTARGRSSRPTAGQSTRVTPRYSSELPTVRHTESNVAVASAESNGARDPVSESMARRVGALSAGALPSALPVSTGPSHVLTSSTNGATIEARTKAYIANRRGNAREGQVECDEHRASSQQPSAVKTSNRSCRSRNAHHIATQGANCALAHQPARDRRPRARVQSLTGAASVTCALSAATIRTHHAKHPTLIRRPARGGHPCCALHVRSRADPSAGHARPRAVIPGRCADHRQLPRDAA